MCQRRWTTSVSSDLKNELPINYHHASFRRQIQVNLKLGVLLGCVLTSAHGVHASRELTEPIRAIRAVELEGGGNVEAARAWRKLAASDAPSLPIVLAAMDGANDIAANWFRSAVETIADRELNAGSKLPLTKLRQFLLDTRHDPRARRLAFDLIARVDPAAADTLLTGMVNDPGPELRRDAVQKIIRQAEQSLAGGDKPRAVLLFHQSLTFARDVDQIDGITKQLRTQGQTVDLLKLFGFVNQWRIIGPFDSTGRKGFAAIYPPEQKIDLEAEYEGKSGRVRWQNFVTTDERGVVSMNKPFTALKGVAAYAWTEFYADKLQSVELRLGSQNAWKVWLNGKFLFGQDEYHRNKAMDQYRMSGQLQPGRNVILVKVCQNEQTEDWAGDWDFQLRVCDALGTPIQSSSNTTPTRTPRTEANR